MDRTQHYNAQQRPAWHNSPKGTALRHIEERVLGAALEDVFGLELLQLGLWSALETTVAASTLRHHTRVAEYALGRECIELQARLTQLPLLPGAVDAVLLAHTLELHSDPHAVLREADRVLRAEGQILVLGFGPWGLLRWQRPPGMRRALSARRVRDWLVLFGYEVGPTQRHFYAWPASAWLLKARKRVYGQTPLRLRRRERQKMLGVAAES